MYKPLLVILIALMMSSCSKERRVEYFIDMELGSYVDVVYSGSGGIKYHREATDGWNTVHYMDPGEYISIHIARLTNDPKISVKILVDGDLLYAKTDSGKAPLIISYGGWVPKHSFFMLNN